MKKILPLLLIIIGIGAGGAAGFVLRPEPEPVIEEEEHDVTEEVEQPVINPETLTYVKLNNQFVVPVLENDKVTSLVVLTISLETSEDQTALIFAREPKIRDEFLRVLFDHAYSGGFNGSFTASPILDSLSKQLLGVAQKVVNDLVTDVLITDILRQDN